MITAAHDVSDGGLACALAECAISGGVGVQADLDPLVELRGASGETCLFGEGPGGFVVTGPVGPRGPLRPRSFLSTFGLICLVEVKR